MSAKHIPVLAETLLQWISIGKDAVFVDCTLGHGGHAYLISKKLSSSGMIIGFDVDQKSLDYSADVLAGAECRAALVKSNFCRVKDNLHRLGIEKADLILADLGFSSGQVEDPDRGMSFQNNMPLDMRLDEDIEITAADIVNTVPEEELADIIYQYGEERASRKIARLICQRRQHQKITSTGQLASLTARVVRTGGKQHPATRTFQALRIAVNDELGALGKLLQDAPDILNPGGQIAVISFHSLEDRIVKQNFKENKQAGIYEIVTKKPLTASEGEVSENPRSRSAKLRIAKLN
ncbi:Ribosomal RNA small subunit methyltransferase H [Sedimentisphaera cyanobacteriorum]|uniref:Ribosomal RNA small subunit methyltransferase H n=1 Tax=Sedimentisphaera cyanobacteriorum TaxID=1940790 RepID=A0A1Q2HQ23_9BACT|nr:16S rRNA (cytosine(1402)-N(4))-methyltransferase RsmH [Sedimentisphaera cyanobacteriorum]AQQ09547.1 Ribosomal RNA small subunit methyltransferase H [Sedimentisphaera cyanobacteriorum]